MFRKVRLDCSQIADPTMQLALLLHNPQTANEVFLLSLRDCVVTLPKSHPLNRWVQQKMLHAPSVGSEIIMHRLEGELKGIWSAQSALKPEQRQGLIRLLDDLEDMPPYLDYLMLRAVGYLKLGNWARTEKIIAEWLERNPLERMRETPWRHDPLGKLTLGMLDELCETLAKGLEGKVIVDLFFQGVREFYSDADLLKVVEKYQELDEGELREKLLLRYHQTLVPGFAAWILNRDLEGRQRRRFLDDFFSRPNAAQYLWVFLGRLPLEGPHKEAVVRDIALAKAADARLFHSMVNEPSLRGVMQRVAPELTKNTLKERRHYFLKNFKSDSRDAWSLMQLIEMGQVDESMVQELARE